MSRIKLIVSLFFVTLFSSAFSCAEISVVDDAGRIVVLEKPAERIVALSPHIVENLFSAGAGKNIIAAVEYSDYPEAAKKIQRVGRFDTFSIENILALNPDLVIVWGSGGGSKIINTLESLGFTVYVDEPSSLESVANSILRFSTLAGTEEIGRPVAENFLKKLERLKRDVDSKRKLKVFYQLWHNPIQTINREHIISDVMRLCGGENIFADLKSIAPKVNVEAVLQKDPNVIIASGADNTRPEWLNEWDSWDSVSAVADKNLYYIPPDYIQRHTLRILKGVELMCRYIDDSRSVGTH